jgi:hypothetical protein
MGGEHTRPRVFRPAPSPVDLPMIVPTKGCVAGLPKVVGEGLDHCTRGAYIPWNRTAWVRLKRSRGLAADWRSCLQALSS